MTPAAKTESTLPVTFDDVLAAREFIAPYLPKTPLVRSEKLSALLECDYYLKCENVQPIGAFKVRGGVNLVGTNALVRTPTSRVARRERSSPPAPAITASRSHMRGGCSGCL